MPVESKQPRSCHRGETPFHPKPVRRRSGRCPSTLHDRLINAQQVGNWLQVRRQRNDIAHVEVTIWPPVEAVSNARSQRIVDCRVAKRALNCHRFHAAIGVKKTRDANHRIEPEARKCDSRVIKVDFALLELCDKRCGKRVHVDFQSDAQGGLGAQSGADPSKFCSFDRVMKLEGVAPVQCSRLPTQRC